MKQKHAAFQKKLNIHNSHFVKKFTTYIDSNIKIIQEVRLFICPSIISKYLTILGNHIGYSKMCCFKQKCLKNHIFSL